MRRNTTLHPLWQLTLMFVLCLGTAQAGKIKCWTNSDGVRECGNIVPQEYTQGGHDEIDTEKFVKRRVLGVSDLTARRTTGDGDSGCYKIGAIPYNASRAGPIF